MDHLQVKREPTHFSELDPKAMKVGDLRDELEARNLSSKGRMNQLICRFATIIQLIYCRFEATIDWSASESIEK